MTSPPVHPQSMPINLLGGVVGAVPQIDTVGGEFIGGFMLWKRMTRIEGIGNPLLILTASQPFL